jgi:homoserine dehydrogenase
MINIGLIGFGNVGKGVYDILSQNTALLTQRIGQPINIAKIAVRSPEKHASILPNDLLTTDVNGMIADPTISIIVEVMGGEHPAYEYICNALNHKKYVVTANKEVISTHKKTFFSLSKENGVDIYFEASVGGGIPIIRSLKVGLAANRIDQIAGILNGTTNYMLSQIETKQQPFDVILKAAQDAGFAEADPSMDIDGIDAAHKLVILAAVAFKADVQLSDIYYEGIRHITLQDIQHSSALGYKIKLIALAKRLNEDLVSLRVHPTLIHNTHLLSNINNEFNAAYISGNAVGEVLLSGKGAGGSPTGSAVVSDIIDIAFDISQKMNRRNLETELNPVAIQPISDILSQFYIRLSVADEPHMLEKITHELSECDINILTLSQPSSSSGFADIIIITHKTQESNFEIAKKRISRIDKVSIETTFRVGIS